MTTSQQIYDSAERRPPLAELRHLWEYRSLVRLLATRDLTLRYKRSVLGVWWTLLNPLITVLVFWVIFSQVFGRQAGDAPFIVYLTTGILMAQYFSQGLVAAGSAIINNRGILIKVHVPPEVFSAASAVAAAFNFVISLVPLIVVQIATGTGIGWSFVAVAVSMLSMLMLITGLGMLVASVAVAFYDVFELTRVLALLATYLAATFYPLDIVPTRYQWLIEVNPLYHHIQLFRSFAYGQPFSWVGLVAVVLSSLVAMWIGMAVFARSWKNVVVTL